MRRVTLIHWNASEATERAARLRAAGFQVDIHAPQDQSGFRSLRDNPPEAFVIDLGRLPAQGCGIAVWLRRQKATRPVPIVFLEGDPEKVARVRRRLPDAVYASWGGVRSALRQAIRTPPENPVVPGTMEGYSGTPLAKKLGIRAGSVVAVLGAPAGFAGSLDGLPENVRFVDRLRGEARLILLFAKSLAHLDRKFPEAARKLSEGGGLWLIWPKKASGVATDLTEPVVRKFGLTRNFVDYKICAVDATWSGLLFARRSPSRRAR